MKRRLQRWPLFVLLFVVGIYIVVRLIYNGIEDDIQIVGILLVLWLGLAYLLLPRVYRRLSGLYVPDYFIGRTKTADGMLGDPINLAFNGTEKQLVTAMLAAGWFRADPLSFRSSLAITKASILSRPYDSAPVSSLFLFGRKQDMAFERQYGNNPRRRHHIRFWKTPEGWWLPGGHQADWVAAATFDKKVGLSLFTGQITHKISEDIDTERAFVIGSLKDISAVKTLEIVEHYTSAYRARNGGGDEIETDGALPFITLQNLPENTSRN